MIDMSREKHAESAGRAFLQVAAGYAPQSLKPGIVIGYSTITVADLYGFNINKVDTRAYLRQMMNPIAPVSTILSGQAGALSTNSSKP